MIMMGETGTVAEALRPINTVIINRATINTVIINRTAIGGTG